MLKGTCRVKMVKAAGEGEKDGGTDAATRHSLSPRGWGMVPGERVLADLRGPHSTLLGLLLPLPVILTRWSLLRVSWSSSL